MRFQRGITLAFLAIFAAVWMESAVAQLSSTLTVPTTIPAGSTITLTITPATQPVTPPPIVVPPVNPPVTPPATQPSGYIAAAGEFLDTLCLPGINGQSYASTLWLASFPKDVNGFIIPPIPSNAVYCSTATTPGHLATDSGDFNSAVAAMKANGSNAIVLRDGGTYPLTFWDQNLGDTIGTANHPVLITRTGPGGFTDHSLPRPICQGGFGLNDGRAGHPASNYIIVDGLDFQGANPPTQQQCLGFLDSNSGTPSTHVLVEDCRFEHFITGTSIQSTNTYPLQTVIFRRCVWEHCYLAFYGEYHFHVQDFLMLDCVLANCGWDAQVLRRSPIRLGGNTTAMLRSIRRPRRTIHSIE